MNKYTYTYICNDCGEECVLTEGIDEIPYAPDHEYGGAKWMKVEVQVSDCCLADFETKKEGEK